PAFKRWWTRIVPEAIERSTYVLLSSLILALLFWQWQPLRAIVWSVQGEPWAGLLTALFWLGWLIALASTFMINHFDLFGLRQVWFRAKNRPYAPVPFVKVLLYRFVRHPLMLGFIIAFWSAPVMTAGHFIFSLATTAYIFVGVFFEERDLRRAHGAAYEQYMREAGMILPFPRSR
ncbi:MAG: isoprenylcysteine carboxylmethyltransferase family protein, partial [Betaproteobacteria bacterium]|nr:isoprenylcysteine carboxylmethyltransferase family protein [Betaproteobacteria bacterium]